jgi:type I restriction enzyme S subunit
MTWQRRPLEEVADFCLGKMLDQKKNRGELLPYLANVNVRWGDFDLDDLREMRFEPSEIDRYSLKSGDIVMCEGGEPGRCAIWKEQRPGMMIQKALHRIRPHGCLDQRFLYYSFLKKGQLNEFTGLFTGATIKHLPREKLAKVLVEVPPLSVQQRIADLLSAYDDLIENNKKRIALLEEAARLLYREWFVHLRFPGHEHAKIVNGLPEGWSSLTFDDACEAIGGGTPSTGNTAFWNDGDIPWYTPTDITRNSCLALLESEKKITEAGLRGSSAKILPAGTVLMTSRASVGYFGIINAPSCTNQGFINIVPHEPSARMYLLQNLVHRVEEIRSHAGGATYKEISKGKFKALPVVLPERGLLREFEDQISALHTQVRTLHTMNQKLAAARDLLLPRLMNGEIAV